MNKVLIVLGLSATLVCGYLFANNAKADLESNSMIYYHQIDIEDNKGESFAAKCKIVHYLTDDKSLAYYHVYLIPTSNESISINSVEVKLKDEKVNDYINDPRMGTEQFNFNTSDNNSFFKNLKIMEKHEDFKCIEFSFIIQDCSYFTLADNNISRTDFEKALDDVELVINYNNDSKDYILCTNSDKVYLNQNETYEIDIYNDLVKKYKCPTFIGVLSDLNRE